MNNSSQKPDLWKRMQVTNPLLLEPVAVIAARGISYVEGGNRLQTLNLYPPATEDNLKLVGMSASGLPQAAAERRRPNLSRAHTIAARGDLFHQLHSCDISKSSGRSL